ncbi:MAG: GreA/GreB family elongation factor [Thermovirgaceae bacterium]
MSEQKICITDSALKRLKNFQETRDLREHEIVPDWREKGKQKKAVMAPAKDIPKDLITTNSTVSLVDLYSNTESVCTLFFPEETDSAAGKIAILAPVGTALPGYIVGDVIEWEGPAGKRRLEVKEILDPPEASGDYNRWTLLIAA